MVFSYTAIALEQQKRALYDAFKRSFGIADSQRIVMMIDLTVRFFKATVKNTFIYLS